MRALRFNSLVMAGFALACLMQDSFAQTGPAGADARVRFNRDIRPILADHCLACHGPDSQARPSELRFDRRDSATAATESGERPIVPGRPDESQLIARILSDDPEFQMPPPETGKPLTADQIALLQRWIAEGAEYELLWSWISPERPDPPAVRNVDWIGNEIDAFILARLEAEELQPSPAAEWATLIRRLSLDLTGLPPAPRDVQSFVNDMTAAGASPDGGEAARDAVYLRWVDRYLSSPHYGERMAVDWLDAARYADTNGYQVDRDREMYAWRDWVIAAFNANMPFDQFTIEQLAGDLLLDATQSQRIATGFHRNHMLNEEGGVIPEEFLAEYCADRVETTAAVWLGQTLLCARCHDHKFDDFTQRDYYGLYAFFHNVSESGLGNYGAAYRRSAPPFLELRTPEVEAALADLRGRQTDVQQRLTQLDEQLQTKQPEWEAQLREKLAAAEQQGVAVEPAVPAEVVAVLAKSAGERSEADLQQLTAYQQSSDADRKVLADEVAALTSQIQEAEGAIPTTLVMEELPQPRVTHILVRGDYSQHGEEVTAATPANLLPMPAEWPRNRLGLAQWLTDPANPLTARVTVNRLWQSLFGTGLVLTSEDFGTQGAAPSHPELLDWLAVEFVESGWDIQHMLRLMVGSSTYRQSSAVTLELLERDPANVLLARGPRFRLQAEFLRDQALSVSGLLVPEVGGPSVKPYHPPGLYEQVTAGNGTNVYVEGTGKDLYRRSLYTYWKRSVPHPAMLVFDATFRESCTLRRSRTNTPLQALNMLNDPTYVEAARFLAGRMIAEGGTEPASQLDVGFRLVLARAPTADELNVLTNAYQRAVADFQADVAAAEQLLAVGATRSPAELDTAQLAAMTTIAGTLLNLDEALMRE